MRKSWMLLAVVLSGCGGTSPELYDLVITYFTLPDSCYANAMQPSTVATTLPPGLMQVQVWDGPDNVTYLEVQGTGRSIDMGAAPNVPVSGIFTGKRADKGGWLFTSDSVTKQTLPSNNVITDTTHAELTFERAAQFKGTAAVNSTRACTGTLCPNSAPSCTVGGIALSGTKLAVQYERAP